LAVIGKPLHANHGDGLRTFGLAKGQTQQYVALDTPVVTPGPLVPTTIGVDPSRDRNGVPAMWRRDVRRRLQSNAGRRCRRHFVIGFVDELKDIHCTCSPRESQTKIAPRRAAISAAQRWCDQGGDDAGRWGAASSDSRIGVSGICLRAAAQRAN
jgi:hypothetical protein